MTGYFGSSKKIPILPDLTAFLKGTALCRGGASLSTTSPLLVRSQHTDHKWSAWPVTGIRGLAISSLEGAAAVWLQCLQLNPKVGNFTCTVHAGSTKGGVPSAAPPPKLWRHVSFIHQEESNTRVFSMMLVVIWCVGSRKERLG